MFNSRENIRSNLWLILISYLLVENVDHIFEREVYPMGNYRLIFCLYNEDNDEELDKQNRSLTMDNKHLLRLV